MTEITPAEVSASLTAAKTAGGSAFFAEAQRLTAAGATLGFADRALVDSMTRARAINNISPPEEAPAPDERSPEAKAHDVLHGMGTTDPTSYLMVEPPGWGAGFSPAERGAFMAQARTDTAALGFSQATGSSFINQIMQTTVAGDALSPDARAAQGDQWVGELKQTYGDRLPEIVKELDKLAEKSPLIQRLAASGLLKNPALFRALTNRSNALALHSSTRPK